MAQFPGIYGAIMAQFAKSRHYKKEVYNSSLSLESSCSRASISQAGRGLGMESLPQLMYPGVSVM